MIKPTPSRPFHKLLIANRGEIAVRIARACRELDITSVAVYSEADRYALHVRACDEAYFIGPAPAKESYLRGDVIIEVARQAACDAIHPGFGFLSENADFARAVIEAGLTWVGPSPEAMSLMGSKIEAKKVAQRAGVPVVPGYFGEDQTTARLQKEADKIGFPVLIKASAGGGGKGMRVVDRPDDLSEGVAAAQREALAAFGDASVMLEKYLQEPRHIEVQVLGDAHGHIIHLGERECSIQRRHQKVMEESPSPIVTPEMRQRLTQAALSLARAAGYSSAGTVEFIYQDGEFYFLEMNTRLQVEHTVTEEALDIDLVEAQLRIAAGEPLWIEQDDIEFVGHAVEVRLYAEDPERGFLPSTGKITTLALPIDDPEVRIDAGVSQGDSITPFYDPMIAKIITSGETRSEALRRLREVLGGLQVEGVRTNLDFLRWLVSHAQVDMGNLSTGFIEKYYRPGAFLLAPVPVIVAGAAVLLLSEDYGDPTNPPLSIWDATAWRLAGQQMGGDFLIEGHTYSVRLSRSGDDQSSWDTEVREGENVLLEATIRLDLRPQADGAATFDRVPSVVQLELPGTPLYALEYGWGSDDWVSIMLDNREFLVASAPPLSTERMDTNVHSSDENSLESPMPGKVLRVLVDAGDTVEQEQALVIIEAMKMEFTVRAPHGGIVADVKYQEGDQVAVGDILVELSKPGTIETGT
jgi:3-methylcrotonyl-CoA carboxylase alpha subunit